MTEDERTAFRKSRGLPPPSPRPPRDNPMAATVAPNPKPLAPTGAGVDPYDPENFWP